MALLCKLLTTNLPNSNLTICTDSLISYANIRKTLNQVTYSFSISNFRCSLNRTEEQKIKKLHLQKPRRAIFKVFFTLKTMPLSVFRYQVLRLSTEWPIFLCNQMDTSNRINVVPFDYIKKRVIQYSDVRPDSEKRTTASFQREKYIKNGPSWFL